MLLRVTKCFENEQQLSSGSIELDRIKEGFKQCLSNSNVMSVFDEPGLWPLKATSVINGVIRLSKQDGFREFRKSL